MLLSKKTLCNINKTFSSISNNDLISKLNAIGIEVENVIETKPVHGLIVGKILSAEKVENSDKLNLCSVETINGIFQVVCGAKNARPNIFIVFAPVGTKISDELTISSRKIRGIESNGMICGYSEINPEFAKFLSDQEKNLIIELDIDDNLEALNSNIYDLLDLNDVIYELSLPSNRNDLNGVLSIVNELNYQFDYKFEFSNKSLVKNVSNPIVEIQDNDLINDYLFLNFTLFKKWNKTPWYIKKALINANINTFDNIADLGNYLTLMLGQPVHLYDLDKLENKLIIKKLDTPQSFTTLNNLVIECKENTLVGLTKNNEIASLISVIGSDKFKIDNDSVNILVELINIDNIYVFNLLKNLKIKSTAGNIFSKSLSPFFISLSYYFLKNILEKKYTKKLNILSCNLKPFKNIKFKFDLNKVQSILGLNLSKYKIESILNKTNIKIDFLNNVIVPKNRIDISNNNDIAEEIVKSLDINDFTPIPIEIVKQFNEKNIEYKKHQLIHDSLLNLGFINTKTFNLTSLINIEQYNLFDLHKYKISNPISSDKEWFRTSLIPSLLDVFLLNHNKKEPNLNLYEIQTLYDKNKHFQCLSILISTPINNNLLNNNEDNDLSTQIKFVLNNIFSKFNLDFNLVDSNYNIFNNMQKDIIVENNKIGYLGCLSPKILSKHKYNHPIFVIEINLDFITNNFKSFKYSQINQFNNINRELTFIVNDDKSNISSYLNELRKNNNILDVNIISIFNDKTNKKSFTIQITIDNKNNLVHEEINKIFDYCIKLLHEYNLTLKV